MKEERTHSIHKPTSNSTNSHQMAGRGPGPKRTWEENPWKNSCFDGTEVAPGEPSRGCDVIDNWAEIRHLGARLAHLGDGSIVRHTDPAWSHFTWGSSTTEADLLDDTTAGEVSAKRDQDRYGLLCKTLFQRNPIGIVYSCHLKCRMHCKSVSKKLTYEVTIKVWSHELCNGQSLWSSRHTCTMMTT